MACPLHLLIAKIEFLMKSAGKEVQAMDWSNIALAMAALLGLVVVMVQFGFEMAAHGSPVKPKEHHPQEHSPRVYKKAA